MTENKYMKFVLRILGGFLLLGIVIQFLPFGRDRQNPPVLAEPNWNDPRTRELFFRGCSDCHSNQTVWPWYSYIAPASWLIEQDVKKGRSGFNISEWGRPDNEGDRASRMVQRKRMPLWYYTPLHPSSALTDAEKQEFITGLIATFGERRPRSEKK